MKNSFRKSDMSMFVYVSSNHELVFITSTSRKKLKTLVVRKKKNTTIHENIVWFMKKYVKANNK